MAQTFFGGFNEALGQQQQVDLQKQQIDLQVDAAERQEWGDGLKLYELSFKVKDPRRRKLLQDQAKQKMGFGSDGLFDGNIPEEADEDFFSLTKPLDDQFRKDGDADKFARNFRNVVSTIQQSGGVVSETQMDILGERQEQAQQAALAQGIRVGEFRQTAEELTPEQQAITREQELGLLTRGGAGEGLLKQAEAKVEFSKADPSKFTSASIRKAEQSGLNSDLVLNEGKAARDLGSKSVFDATNDLRDDFLGLSKTFREVRDSFARIQESSKDPSAAGDLALIFNFMKMLDPRSVVRESEFATAANAAGVPEKIRRSYNRILEGEKLGPSQRNDFVTRAEVLFGRQDKQHRQRENTFRGLATKFNLDPAAVVIDINDPLFNSQVVTTNNVSGLEAKKKRIAELKAKQGR